MPGVLGHTDGRRAAYRRAPSPARGDEVMRQIDFWQAARHQQPTMVRHYLHAGPPSLQNRYYPFHDCIKFRVNLACQPDSQRMPKPVELSKFQPAAVIAARPWPGIVRPEDRDANARQLFAQ